MRSPDQAVPQDGRAMSDAQLSTAITAVAGIVIAVVTGVISYRSARWTLRKDLEIDLRHQRLDAFKSLWALSEPLAKYGRTGPASSATAASIEKPSGDLRHW